MIIENQKDLIKFALQYVKDGWFDYASDKLTVEIICATVNLGIIEISDINISRQFKLKSEFWANRFLNNH